MHVLHDHTCTWLARAYGYGRAAGPWRPADEMGDGGKQDGQTDMDMALQGPLERRFYLYRLTNKSRIAHCEETVAWYGWGGRARNAERYAPLVRN